MPRAHASRLFTSACLLILAVVYPTVACCPAPRLGEWVVNADQTVIMIWDPAAKRQHFIRQASFQAETKDFGFLIPSPTQPELAEAGNEAFATLHQITAPKIIHQPHNQGGGGCNFSCSAEPKSAMVTTPTPAVRVLEEKLVAGFNASVLEADNTDVLIKWLEDHGYAFSPAVAEWAKPYVEQGWKITALKVAPPEAPPKGAANPIASSVVKASALRLSFDTDRPLFPYREPDYAKTAGDDEKHKSKLAAAQRLLRIYFVSNARYQGELTPEQPWTGKVAWARKLTKYNRTKLLEQLQLPPETGPAEFYLTEFEDRWPYKVAPADVYFAAATDQSEVRRPDVYVHRESGSDVSLAILIALAFTPLLWRRKRQGSGVFGE